jgi:hypothetical protein
VTLNNLVKFHLRSHRISGVEATYSSPVPVLGYLTNKRGVRNVIEWVISREETEYRDDRRKWGEASQRYKKRTAAEGTVWEHRSEMSM